MKNIYKLVDIDKKGRYIFEKASVHDILLAIPRNMLYVVTKKYKPILLIKHKLPSKEVWDKLED